MIKGPDHIAMEEILFPTVSGQPIGDALARLFDLLKTMWICS